MVPRPIYVVSDFPESLALSERLFFGDTECTVSFIAHCAHSAGGYPTRTILYQGKWHTPLGTTRQKFGPENRTFWVLKTLFRDQAVAHCWLVHNRCSPCFPDQASFLCLCQVVCKNRFTALLCVECIALVWCLAICWTMGWGGGGY